MWQDPIPQQPVNCGTAVVMNRAGAGAGEWEGAEKAGGWEEKAGEGKRRDKGTGNEGHVVS